MRGVIYRGDRRGRDLQVTANGQPLRLPPKYRDREAAGYDWGRSTAGAGNLALAVLADASCDDQVAVRWHIVYATEVVSKLGGDHWELTTSDVLRWLVRQYEDVERGRRCAEIEGRDTGSR